MFTGIVEAMGTVARAEPGTGGGRRLWIKTPFDPETMNLGDSIAVNGVCLTVTGRAGGTFEVDAGPETLARTTVVRWAPGERVNLERALTLSARLGGHMVQGHVDSLGRVRRVVQRQNAYDVDIEAAPEVLRLAIPRGSIAVDGISLTVVDRQSSTFRVSIVPHTWRVTTMSGFQSGYAVNLEVDLIARYVAGLLEGADPEEGLTEGFLASQGFS